MWSVSCLVWCNTGRKNKHEERVGTGDYQDEMEKDFLTAILGEAKGLLERHQQKIATTGAEESFPAAMRKSPEDIQRMFDYILGRAEHDQTGGEPMAPFRGRPKKDKLDLFSTSSPSLFSPTAITGGGGAIGEAKSAQASEFAKLPTAAEIHRMAEDFIVGLFEKSLAGFEPGSKGTVPTFAAFSKHMQRQVLGLQPGQLQELWLEKGYKAAFEGANANRLKKLAELVYYRRPEKLTDAELSGLSDEQKAEVVASSFEGKRSPWENAMIADSDNPAVEFDDLWESKGPEGEAVKGGTTKAPQTKTFHEKVKAQESEIARIEGVLKSKLKVAEFQKTDSGKMILFRMRTDLEKAYGRLNKIKAPKSQMSLFDGFKGSRKDPSEGKPEAIETKMTEAQTYWRERYDEIDRRKDIPEELKIVERARVAKQQKRAPQKGIGSITDLKAQEAYELRREREQSLIPIRNRRKLIGDLFNRLFVSELHARDALSAENETKPEDLRYAHEGESGTIESFTSRSEKDIGKLGDALVDGARRSNKDAPNITKRLTLIQDRLTDAVYLVSTYRRGREVMLLDPAHPTRMHISLGEIIKRYRIVKSLLRDSPVVSYKEKFESLSDYNRKLGEEAEKRDRYD
jgi:hypothetical protein